MKWSGSTSDDDTWRSAIDNYDAKERIARTMAQRLRDGDVVGVGSGSTSLLTLHALADVARSREWRFVAITTSLEIEIACAELGVATQSLLASRPEWSFDGADQVDEARNMIKGRGGAMVRERLVMTASPERYVVVDRSKLVPRLNGAVAVPIEIIPEALRVVESRLRDAFDATVALRHSSGKDGPVITERGNVIVDVSFGDVPPELDESLTSIPGVVGTGLFVGFSPTLVSS